MVNLLFISNSTKIDTIKNALQPFLKVKIDIVSNFDYGLKDVFEKRPATVFIQDQIAGVTGESVARHIQMLLGSAAPTFIFMHEGSAKATPIKGLFEYLIDLSQEEVKIVSGIQATLKSLLGPQWEKIYIPPKMAKAAIRDVVDNTGSALAGNSCQEADSSGQIAPVDELFQVVSSPHDQLAEMISETSKNRSNTEATTIPEQDTFTKKPPIPEDVTVSPQSDQQSVVLPKSSKATAPVVATDSAQPQPAPRVCVSAAPVAPTKTDDDAVPPALRSVPGSPPLQQASPADFVIARESPTDDVAPEDLLRVFEDNYYSHTGGWKRYVTITVILTMCFGGGLWYLLQQKPHLLAYLSRPSAQTITVVPAARSVEPAITVQKPVSLPAQKAEMSALPTFIPLAGFDSSFSSLKPGWERYVDTIMEFRVYRPAGKIKAIQVLGANKRDISETKLKSILIELVGDGEYRVKSSEKKLGYHVLRADVGQKAELLIYSKQSAIRAFVVSFD